MPELTYTYAVARLRAKELSLFGAAMIEQLLSAKTADECMQLLQDKGWGDGSSDQTPESMLSCETEKIWTLMGELVEDLSAFDVFLLPNDYHNLKACVKITCTDASENAVFLKGILDPQWLLHQVRERAFSNLPAGMAAAAEEAYTALSQTRDGQLCDVTIDRAALEAVLEAGEASGDDVLRDYAQTTVAAANIKTAVRCLRTKKSFAFLKRALAPCDTLNVSLLARAASEGMESIVDYLNGTAYSEAAAALEDSPAAFERWCDNVIIQMVKPQQFQVFGIGPLAGYILGRQNEIKTVRMILAGKRNFLSESAIRERVREMYV